MMGFVAAFGVVFLLLGLALRWLGRLSGTTTGGRGNLRMEVVQRLALGPKQGLAVVRIGDRLLAVSMGDGGVHPVAELGDEELAQIDSIKEESPAALIGSGSFKSLLAAATESPRAKQLKSAFRSATGIAAIVILAIAAVGVIGVGVAEAQQAGAGVVDTADQMINRLSPQMDLQVGDAGEGLRLSGTVGVVVMMGLMTLLPTLILMMTSYTRIFIVMHFLRQAIGTQSAPPAHLMAALSLLLTGFVMAPTLTTVNQTAIEPWLDGQIEQGEMLTTGVQPFREFMLAETRDTDLGTFLDLSRTGPVASADEVPLVVLMSAFVTSELRTAFQIGFAIFLPFIIIDVVVASVLMSMGMFMLPPPMIALPFKILLFVLVDGWTLIVQGLVSSFS